MNEGIYKMFILCQQHYVYYNVLGTFPFFVFSWLSFMTLGTLFCLIEMYENSKNVSHTYMYI